MSEEKREMRSTAIRCWGCVERYKPAEKRQRCRQCEFAGFAPMKISPFAMLAPVPA